eukprot:5744189-Amphidinium_carterae.1
MPYFLGLLHCKALGTFYSLCLGKSRCDELRPRAFSSKSSFLDTEPSASKVSCQASCASLMPSYAKHTLAQITFLTLTL